MMIHQINYECFYCDNLATKNIDGTPVCDGHYKMHIKLIQEKEKNDKKRNYQSDGWIGE